MKTLALSMIVRDAAADLPACLESVRGLVDEVVIADTGSTDATVQVARARGARVIFIPWQDDFALARNLALAAVRSRWVLSLDADERLDPAARQSLPPLLASPEVGGYLVTIRNYVLSARERLWDRPAVRNDGSLPEARPFPAYLEHENVRLFRCHPAITFSGCVHESVGPSLARSPLRLGRAGFVVHHFGLAAAAETRARKNLYYRELGRRKVLESPENAQAHLELGLVELDNFHDYPAALACFERACSLDSSFGVAWFFQALTRCKLQDYSAALHCLRMARGAGYVTALLVETEGDVRYNLGDFSAAARCYRQALDRGASRWVESKLGLAEVRDGAVGRGLRRMRGTIEFHPQSAELHDRLILALVWLDRIAEAAQAAVAKLHHLPSPEAFLRAAALCARSAQAPQAARLLRAGAEQFPHETRLRAALAELEPAFTTTSSPSAPPRG